MLPAPVSVELDFTDGLEFNAPLIDITNLVQLVNIKRGRNNVIDSYQNGTATVQFLDTTGDYNPDNTAGPYFGSILPNRKLRISATYQSDKRYLFSGFVESWSYEWRPGLDLAVVTIFASDAFRLFNLASLSTVAGASAGDTSGQRVSQILDAAGWPSGQRRVSSGGAAVQDDSGDTRSILQALQQVESTELGALYIDAAGDVVFETRAELSERAVQPFPVFFADVLPPGTIPLKPRVGYQQLEVVLDDELLANEVTVTRAGGSPQTVSDATSISQFFKRTLTRTDTLNVDDLGAESIAKSILQNRKRIGLEISSLTFEMVSDEPLRIDAGLDLEFGDPIEVNRPQPGGSSIEAILVVQGIQHDITPGRHDVTLTTSRPLSFAFVLGSVQYGLLGTSTL